MSAFRGVAGAGMGLVALSLAGAWALTDPAIGIGAPSVEVAVPPPARIRIGVALESAWYAQRWAFLGVGVRAEFRSPSGPVAFALEGAWLHERDGDDEVLLFGGSAVVRLLLEGGGSLQLGIGVGWLRWQDAYGWDRGVWDRVYRRLTVGAEVPLASLFAELSPRLVELHGVVEFGSLPPWFHPVVSVGFLLPLSPSKPSEP